MTRQGFARRSPVGQASVTPLLRVSVTLERPIRRNFHWCRHRSNLNSGPSFSRAGAVVTTLHRQSKGLVALTESMTLSRGVYDLEPQSPIVSRAPEISQFWPYVI